jgi:hypothetical protein
MEPLHRHPHSGPHHRNLPGGAPQPPPRPEPPTSTFETQPHLDGRPARQWSGAFHPESLPHGAHDIKDGTGPVTARLGWLERKKCWRGRTALTLWPSLPRPPLARTPSARQGETNLPGGSIRRRNPQLDQPGTLFNASGGELFQARKRPPALPRVAVVPVSSSK